MNERIRELAEQAGFYVSANGAEILIPDPHTEDITGVMEKFAELIVNECASLCEREGQNPFNNVWEKTRAKCDALMIREHFGVKE